MITLAGVALLACASPTDSCGCSPRRPPQTDLFGFVMDGNGPVTGAHVTAKVFPENCQSAGNSLIYAHREAVVDSAGHFRFELQTRQPDTLCARLVARAGVDSLVRDSVPVITQWGDDSVRVDFRFP